MSPDCTEHEPLLRYAIIADTHLRPSGESSSPWATNLLANDRARWVIKRVNSSGASLVFHLGDIVHPVPHQPSYGSAAKVAKSLFEALDAPLHMVPGNHDVGDKHNPHMPSFTVDQHGLDLYRSWFGDSYGAFDYGGIHFALINSSILNSGLPYEDEQKCWLEADLEEHHGERIHLFSHYPPFIVERCEPSNYDNIDEPARTWLLDLLKDHSVEALFAGHVHQFGYNTYGCTRIYNLFSTCFVRQDYSEMFHIEPAEDYGRNDAAKLGWCTVDVYRSGHHTLIHRSYGRALSQDKQFEQLKSIEPARSIRATSSLGVHLRHSLVETLELPYNGPIDEFTRKTVRNDYPILGLWETRIRDIRTPLVDLQDPVRRSRFKELFDLGHKIFFFTVGPPTASDIEAMHSGRELIDLLEVILPWDKADESLHQILKAREELDIPIFLANIESSVHREKGGPTFSHYISHGFRVDDLAPLDEFITRTGASVEGYSFQVGEGRSPLSQILEATEYADRKGFKALINVRLSSENPAQGMFDDDYVANRAAESLLAAYIRPRARVFLDTFMDLDRGYFPRHGLYDRRWNPRRGASVLSNLKIVLDGEDGIVLLGMKDSDGYRAIEFKSNRMECTMLLPEAGGRLDATSLGLQEDEYIIDLVRGFVHPAGSPPEICNQCLVVRDDQTIGGHILSND